VGVSRDEGRLTEELLFRYGPEESTREMQRRGACFQVVLSVQPPQPE